MKIMRRKTIRLSMLLVVALSTFVTGFSAFYFYARAAALLFQPKQSALETTQTLTPRAAAPFLVEFAPTPVPAQSSPAQYQTNDDAGWRCENCIQDEEFGLCVPLTGEYVNNQYAYMLTIPEEAGALQAPPPAPDHGFVARISEDPEAVLKIQASFEDGSTVESRAVKQELAYLKSHAASLEILKRTVTRLDKRQATRYVAQYVDSVSGRLMIEDKIVSVRKDCAGEDALAIVYVISLETPAESYGENRKTLEKILKRWTELELDCC